MATIEPMMKVNLSFTAGVTPDEMNIPLEHPDFEFIFGIGSGGLTPFEYELVDMEAGGSIDLQLRSTDTQRFFEHLYPSVRGLFLDRSELFLNVRITAIGAAEGPEIIKAMAEMTARSEGGSGCGGGCGCGCS